MDAQMKKGLLDACVLSVLKQGDAYGYKLTQDISAIIKVSESALYPVLRRLESQGFLETYSEEYSGRLRKYYRITPAGLKKLDDEINALRELKKVLDHITGGGENG